MTSNRFWATALAKYGNGATETRGLFIADFFNTVEKGAALSTQQLGWADGTLFATSSFAAEFARGLWDAGEIDVSEESIEQMP